MIKETNEARKSYFNAIDRFSAVWDRACDQTIEAFDAWERENAGDLTAINYLQDQAIVAAIADNYTEAAARMNEAAAILEDCVA